MIVSLRVVGSIFFIENVVNSFEFVINGYRGVKDYKWKFEVDFILEGERKVKKMFFDISDERDDVVERGGFEDN